MDIQRGCSLPSTEDPEEYSTGDVRINTFQQT
jgi:hypothetical protein